MQLEDVKDTLAAKRRQQAAERIPFLRAIQAEATSMSALLTDPNWERYGRHIEAELGAALNLAKDCERRLTDVLTPLDPAHEAQTKAQLAYSRGAMHAYTTALSIAKDLINKGERAGEMLAELAENGQ